MQCFDATTSTLQHWHDLVELFSSTTKTTGFIVCLDELSKVRKINCDAYTELMDGLLSFSQYTIAKGGYFAFVGTSLYIYDFGEVVLQASGRAMRQIKFPHPKEVEETTKSLVRHSQAFVGPGARQNQVAFDLKVALQVGRSTPKMSYWFNLANSQSKIYIPQSKYTLPKGVLENKVFLLAAETALGQTKPRE